MRVRNGDTLSARHVNENSDSAPSRLLTGALFTFISPFDLDAVFLLRNVAEVKQTRFLHSAQIAGSGRTEACKRCRSFAPFCLERTPSYTLEVRKQSYASGEGHASVTTCPTKTAPLVLVP
jgi:hypothetical protein